MATTIPLFGPIPGGPELLIILLVLVLLFGANKIPKLARSTGQAMGEFKKGREEVEDELRQMQDGSTDEERTETTADTTTAGTTTETTTADTATADTTTTDTTTTDTANVADEETETETSNN